MYRGGHEISPEMRQQQNLDKQAAANQAQNALNLARAQGNASGDYAQFNSLVDPNRVAQILGQRSGYQIAQNALNATNEDYLNMPVRMFNAGGF